MAENDAPKPTAAELNRKRLKKTYAISKKALELAVKYDMPANPTTFAVWYAYVAKSSKELVAKIDELLAEKGSVSIYDVSLLHDNFLIRDPAHEAKFEKLGDDIEKEVSTVMKLVEDSIASNQTYSSTLDETEAELPNAVSQEKVREVVATLIEQNREVKEMAENLNQGLQKSQSEISRLNDQISETRQESMRDSLTSLTSRRFFDDKIVEEYDHAMKNGTHLSVVMAELDDLERINDTYGQQVGDGILQTFANLLSKNTKRQDVATRYSATEFALILPQTSLKDAGSLVKKLSSELDESWMVVKSTGEAVGKLTCSFGISMLRPGLDAERLIERVEQKLQDAKAQGGNTVKVDLANAAAA